MFLCLCFQFQCHAMEVVYDRLILRNRENDLERIEGRVSRPAVEEGK